MKFNYMFGTKTRAAYVAELEKALIEMKAKNEILVKENYDHFALRGDLLAEITALRIFINDMFEKREINVTQRRIFEGLKLKRDQQK